MYKKTFSAIVFLMSLLRASHYGFVKSAISNSAHPFLSFTARAMTDDFEVFPFL